MQNWTFNINIPTLNVPISTNKVSTFKLTIEDYFKGYFGLIRSQFFSLSLTKSVAFFLGLPVYCLKEIFLLPNGMQFVYINLIIHHLIDIAVQSRQKVRSLLSSME